MGIESRYNLLTRRRGISADIEKTIRRSFYKNEQDALEHYTKYHDISVEPQNDNIDEEVETE